MTPLDPLSFALQPWQNFFMLTGAAAATLVGLMFIAVTFSASIVTKETSPYARAFLDPMFMHFVQVLFTGCLLMIPTLTAPILGALLVVLGGARFVSLHGIYKRYRDAQLRNSDIELSDWLVGIVAPLLCHALVIASGVGLLRHRPIAITGIAIGTLGLLVIGIYGAWELLVWMVMMVGQKKGDAKTEADAPKTSDPSP